MKIAITVWEDRVSPVFDAANMLLLAELEDGDILNRRFVFMQPVGSMRFVEMLKQMGITVLICGAISEGHANRLSFNGIDLIPFIAGKTEKILETFAKGEAIIPAFSMPGCGQQCCKQTADPIQNQDHREETEMPGQDKAGPSGKGPGTGQVKGRCKSGPDVGKGTGKGAGKDRNTGRGQGGKGGRGRQSK